MYRATDDMLAVAMESTEEKDTEEKDTSVVAARRWSVSNDTDGHAACEAGMANTSSVASNTAICNGAHTCTSLKKAMIAISKEEDDKRLV